MTYRDMCNAGVEVQADIISFRYYDYETGDNVELSEEQAKDREIKYIYPDVIKNEESWRGNNLAIVIEVEPDDE